MNESKSLPRFSYSVPDEILDSFVEEMRKDVRLSPSELINAILIKHYRDQISIDGLGRVAARFSYSIPELIRDEFTRDMRDEVRRNPGDLVDAILIKHYREKARDKVVKDLNATGLPGEEPPRLPFYGPKQAKKDIEIDAKQSGDE